MDVPAQREHTTLPLSRASARDARRFVGSTLRRWQVPDDPVDTACLLTTELVTNAILHAGSDVEVVLESTPEAVRVEVIDTSAAIPKPQPANALTGTTGRGLALVRGLSTTWGVTPRDPGKSVWFELSTGAQGG